MPSILRFVSNPACSVAVAVALVLSGCNLEPKYPAAAVTFDSGLIGEWEVDPNAAAEKGEAPEPPVIVEFTGRALSVEDGRVRPDKPVPGGKVFNGYTVRLTEGKARTVHEFGAFLLPAGEHTLLGFQSMGGPSGVLQHPLHHVLKIKRTGDRLEHWSPKYGIVWMPIAQPLDGPVTDALPVPTIADLEARSKGGMFVTFDIDRMLAVYQEHAASPDFWTTESSVLVRKGAPRGRLDGPESGIAWGAGMGGR